MLRISGRNFCLSAKEEKHEKQRMGVPEIQVFVRLRSRNCLDVPAACLPQERKKRRNYDESGMVPFTSWHWVITSHIGVPNLADVFFCPPRKPCPARTSPYWLVNILPWIRYCWTMLYFTGYVFGCFWDLVRHDPNNPQAGEYYWVSGAQTVAPCVQWRVEASSLWFLLQCLK